jgi:hypothetical protein
MARKRKSKTPEAKTQTARLSFRDGNTIVETEVTTTTRSATIDFNDILDAVEVVPDEEARTPWEDCDGYEHTATPVDRLDYEKRDNAEHMQGYAWDSGNRQRVLIEISDEQVKSWGVYDYARAGGASKQVAREMEAKNKADTIKRLAKWYENGWEYWGVTVDFLDEHDSCWGYDDYDYAYHDARLDHAENVACALEKKGYTIENKPVKTATRYGKVWSLKVKQLSQSWVDHPEFDYRATERERLAG